MLEKLAELRQEIEKYRAMPLLEDENENLRTFRLNVLEKVEWFFAKGLFEKAEFAMAGFNWAKMPQGFRYWHQLSEDLSEAWDQRGQNYGPIAEPMYHPFLRPVSITETGGIKFKRVDPRIDVV